MNFLTVCVAGQVGSFTLGTECEIGCIIFVGVFFLNDGRTVKGHFHFHISSSYSSDGLCWQ